LCGKDKYSEKFLSSRQLIIKGMHYLASVFNIDTNSKNYGRPNYLFLKNVKLIIIIIVSL